MGVNYNALRAACLEVLLPHDGDFRHLHSSLVRQQGLHALLMQFRQRSLVRRGWTPLEIDAALNSYAWSMFLLLRGAMPERSKGGLAPWQLRRVREAIEQEPGLSLGQLAGEVGLSPWHFCRAFRVSTGLTPARYQLLLIMERARHALERTNEPVTTIALEAGFGSSQPFARAFRRETGVSPSRYRASRQL